MGAERTILGLGLFVWVAGFVALKDQTWPDHVRRTFGIFVATALLLMLAPKTPKVATGLATIMAITIVGGQATAISTTLRKAGTGVPWQTVHVPGLTPVGGR